MRLIILQRPLPHPKLGTYPLSAKPYIVIKHALIKWPHFFQMRRFQTIAVFLLAFAGTSCGFHLRGSDTVSVSNTRVYVDTSRDSTIREELRKVLSDRSFTVVDNRDSANVLLRVSDEQQSQRIVSVQSTGKVSEYELAHSVNIQVAQSALNELPGYDENQQANRVEVVREYTYDQGGVLGKEDEADILRAEMRRELALQIMLRAVATMASAARSPTGLRQSVSGQ